MANIDDIIFLVRQEVRSIHEDSIDQVYICNKKLATQYQNTILQIPSDNRHSLTLKIDAAVLQSKLLEKALYQDDYSVIMQRLQNLEEIRDQIFLELGTLKDS